jgi:hypothetical protein
MPVGCAWVVGLGCIAITICSFTTINMAVALCRHQMYKYQEVTVAPSVNVIHLSIRMCFCLTPSEVSKWINEWNRSLISKQAKNVATLQQICNFAFSLPKTISSLCYKRASLPYTNLTRQNQKLRNVQATFLFILNGISAQACFNLKQLQKNIYFPARKEY